MSTKKWKNMDAGLFDDDRQVSPVTRLLSAADEASIADFLKDRRHRNRLPALLAGSTGDTGQQHPAPHQLVPLTAATTAEALSRQDVYFDRPHSRLRRLAGP